MSSTAINSLINVRYYGPQDPYHYSTDNRPLTDLNTNIVSLAGLIDGLSSGNVFYVVDSSGVVNSLEATTSLLAPTGPYTAGQLITIRVNNTNTGAVTFTANSGAAYSVNGMSGALQGGELVSGKHYLLSWEDSDAVWELVGSSKGNLQVAAAVRSSQAVNLGQLTDGVLNPTFNVVNAAAGTSGNELVNYTQMTDGSLIPRFSLIERTSSLESQNWLPNSTFLFGFAGWQAPPAGMYTGTTNANTYAGYGGTDPSLQYWGSNLISAGWIEPGSTCTLSGWILNATSSGDAYIVVSCSSASGVYLSTIAASSLSSGEGWTYLSATGVFPTGTAYAQVALGFQGASSGSNIAFSKLKFEPGVTATLWDDVASAQLFQNGQFSPEFDNIQINGSASLQGLTATTATLSGALLAEGSVQLNSKWANGTNGIVIGADIGGDAGIMLNAPSGYSGWLEQLMIDGAIMWHVDSLGDAVAAGGITASAATITGDQTIGGTLTVSGNAVAAGEITASSANITGDQDVGGNLAVTGDATFSSGFALNSSSYLEVNSPSSGNGANIALTGNGTATPTKYLRAQDGGFQVINSAYNQAILNLTDSGNFSVGGTAVAAAGTSGGELVNYTQITNGSLNPTVDNITVNGTAYLNGVATIVGDLSGRSTGFGSSATGLFVGWNFTGDTGEVDLLLGPQSGPGGLNIYQLNYSGNMVSTTPILALDQNGTITSQGNINLPNGQILAGSYGNAGQFNAISGSGSSWYNSMLRNDGSNFYLLVSDVQTTQSAAFSASYNSLRPFSFNLATGALDFDSTGAGASFGGTISAAGGTSGGELVNYTQLTNSSLEVAFDGVSINSSSAKETQSFSVTANSDINGANILLSSNYGGTSTPSKYIRSSGGNLQVLNSAYNEVILGLDDSGDLTVTGGVTAPGGVSITSGNSLIIGTPPSGDAAAIMVNVPTSDGDWLLQLMNNGISMFVVNGNGSVQSASTASAAAGTSGNELVNYTQMTDGSLSPTFGNITTTTQTTTSNQDIGGNLNVSGTASAAAGTSGTELVNYTQITNGSLNPTVDNMTVNGTAYLNGVTTIVGDLSGRSTGFGSSATGLFVGWNFTGDTGEVDLLLGPQSGPGGLNIYQLNYSGNMVSTTPILALAQDGNLEVQGNITSPSNVTVSNTGSFLFNLGNAEGGNNVVMRSDGSDVHMYPWGIPYGDLIFGDSGPYNISMKGNLSVAGTTSAAAGTTGNELVNYAQITDGSLSPTFGNTTTATQTTTSDQTIGGTLAVTGTASAAAGTTGNEVVNISQFAAKPFYTGTWSGSFQTTAEDPVQTAAIITQGVAFPAYSKTGGFRVQVNMTLFGDSTAVGNQNYYTSVTDTQGYSMAGAPWLQNFSATGISWGISDTVFLNKIYTPGEQVTFTVYLNSYGGAGTSTINGGGLQLIVFEA